MSLAPKNLDQLIRALGDASEHCEKIGTVDLSALNRVLDHYPEDMTVPVLAGTTLAAGSHSFLIRVRQASAPIGGRN